MRNRNGLILAGAVVLIGVVALLSLLPQGAREVQTGATVAPVITAAPAATEAASETETPAAAEATAQPAEAGAYLLVTVGGVLYEPVPLQEEGEYTLRRGEEYENVIHVTPDSVYMKSSTCDNQDCVLQGTVTLENMQERVLGNMIICLPNEVTLELYTPEGLAQVIMQQQEE